MDNKKPFDVSAEDINYDETYRYIKTSGAQFGLGGIVPDNGQKRVVLHVINTQFRPSAQGTDVLTGAQRRAVATIEMSVAGARGLHELLGRFIKDSEQIED